MVAGFAGLGARGQWIVVEPTAGGWGAWQGSDGESAMINLSNGSFRNIPAEVYEVKHPVRLEEFAIRRDSGGPGRWRGGCGVVRAYRVLADCDVSLWFERSRTPAWGLFGGKSGRPPANAIEGPQIRATPLKQRARAIPAGTLVRTMTGGGGGYGDPMKRPVDEVVRDVGDGYVSIEGAERDYGVVIEPRTLAVDEHATRNARGG
jgi:N-methylhydantoinase B